MASQMRGVFVTVGRTGFRCLQPRQDDSMVAKQNRMRVGDTMVVQSAQIHQLSDLSQEAFAKSLNEWTSRGSLQILALLFILAPLLVLIYIKVAAEILVGAITLSAAIIIVARYIEEKRRRFILAYDLPAPYVARYEQLCRSLLELGASGAFRGTRSLHHHGDWKRNAGATKSMTIERAAMRRLGLTHIVTNIEPITLSTQGKDICFFPDRILIRHNGQFGVISYQSLKLDTCKGTFIWDAPLPADAVVVGQSWLYTRKDGGPDRRFNGNRQIPDVRVGYLSLETETGLSLFLQATDLGAVQRSHDEVIKYCQQFKSARATEGDVERVELRQALWILGLASLQQAEAVDEAYRSVAERLQPERLALMAPDLANFLSDRAQDVEAAYTLLKTEARAPLLPVLQATAAVVSPSNAQAPVHQRPPRRTVGVIPHAIAMGALMVGLVGLAGYAWKTAPLDSARPAQSPVPPGPPPLPPLAEQPRREEPRRKATHTVHRKNAEKKERLLAKTSPPQASDFVKVDFDHASPSQSNGTTEAAPPMKSAGDESNPTQAEQ